MTKLRFGARAGPMRLAGLILSVVYSCKKFLSSAFVGAAPTLSIAVPAGAVPIDGSAGSNMKPVGSADPRRLRALAMIRSLRGARHGPARSLANSAAMMGRVIPTS